MDAAEALRELADAGDEDLPRLLLRAFRSVNAQVIDSLTALGHPDIRASHAAVFIHLDPDGTRIVTLAQRADMTRQGMSALVHDLETAGYLETRPDPDDRRATRVLLTTRGREFCHQAAGAVRDVEQHWARLLGQNRLRDLRAALRTLAT